MSSSHRHEDRGPCPTFSEGRTRACPECGTLATRQYSPFCSKRCADIDLHRWFNESYRVPEREPEEKPDEF